MAEIADLRTRSVLPIGTVMLLTDLTARQIRYYETQGWSNHNATPVITEHTR